MERGSTDTADRRPKQGPPTGEEADRSAARIKEELAAKILERAAALDAERRTEIEVDQLRQAAAGAGISRESFEQAMRETGREEGAPDALTERAPTRLAARSDFAHYASALRDLLGDEGELFYYEDRIEWRDRGLLVSVVPSADGVTTAVSAEGSFLRRMLAVFLPTLVPLLFTLMVAFEDDEALLVFLGVLLGVAASLIGVWVSYLRERKALRRRVERIRRQLERFLPPGPAGR